MLPLTLLAAIADLFLSVAAGGPEPLTLKRVMGSPALSGPVPPGLALSPEVKRATLVKPRADDRDRFDKRNHRSCCPTHDRPPRFAADSTQRCPRPPLHLPALPETLPAPDGLWHRVFHRVFLQGPRGCTSRNGRRMAQTAAYLVDRVIPPV